MQVIVIRDAQNFWVWVWVPQKVPQFGFFRVLGFGILGCILHQVKSILVWKQNQIYLLQLHFWHCICALFNKIVHADTTRDTMILQVWYYNLLLQQFFNDDAFQKIMTELLEQNFVKQIEHSINYKFVGYCKLFDIIPLKFSSRSFCHYFLGKNLHKRQSKKRVST